MHNVHECVRMHAQTHARTRTHTHTHTHTHMNAHARGTYPWCCECGDGWRDGLTSFISQDRQIFLLKVCLTCCLYFQGATSIKFIFHLTRAYKVYMVYKSYKAMDIFFFCVSDFYSNILFNNICIAIN